MDTTENSTDNDLFIISNQLALEKIETEKLSIELSFAKKELAFLIEEKGKRAEELSIANKELVFQDKEKGKRAEELSIANKELVFQDKEKGKRAEELIIANEELEAAWADKKPPKAALDAAVHRGNAVLNAKPGLKKSQPF